MGLPLNLDARIARPSHIRMYVPFSLGVELVFGSSCDEEAGCGLGLARLECELLPDAEPDGWLAAGADQV